MLTQQERIIVLDYLSFPTNQAYFCAHIRVNKDYP